ncbi:MAG TPA: response regulator transcription factor [Chloroflexota bacterium]|nr:response regulator transcription factor [Chloroflexota bacterium]
METHLLLADPDDRQREDLLTRLREDGFFVHGVGDVTAALDAAERQWPHLALIDLQFPDGTGEHLATELLRRGNLPIVVVSGHGAANSRVRALETFAEDFVTRPYLYPELVARIRRILRRTILSAPPEEERLPLGSGRWVDLRRREVYWNEHTTHLTPTEGRLLELFVLNPDRILPNDLILQRVWCDAPVGVNTLWEFVRRLRTKLGDDARDPRLIRSARGIGYLFRRP